MGTLRRGLLSPVTDHIGLVFFDNRFKLMGTGAQAVDIKRDKFHSHRHSCKVNRVDGSRNFTATATHRQIHGSVWCFRGSAKWHSLRADAPERGR